MSDRLFCRGIVLMMRAGSIVNCSEVRAPERVSRARFTPEWETQ